MAIQVYRLTTLTYGTVHTPIIATACLETSADIGKDYLCARKSMKRDYYMDDYLSGVSKRIWGIIIIIIKKREIKKKYWLFLIHITKINT